MKRYSTAGLLASLLLGTATPIAGQWRAWDLYWENDSFTFVEGSDARYTNGLRLNLTAERAWPLVEAIKEKWFGEYDETNGIVFGQNQFTPNQITGFEEDRRDRPFAGFMHLGVRADFTEGMPDSNKRDGWYARQQHSFEATIGVLGPLAGAGVAQASAHVLRENRIPKGWRHQIETEAAAHLAYDFRVSFRNGKVDLIPHVGGTLGTVQTVARLGGTLRVGTVESFPSLLNTYSATGVANQTSDFQWAVLAAWEARPYAYNTYVDGPIFGESLDIDANHFIKEWRIGIMLRKWNWNLNWSRVQRSAEFVTPAELGVGEGNHTFGSISVGRSIQSGVTSRCTREDPDATGSMIPCIGSWWLRDWILDVGMGVGTSNEEGGPSAGGLAMRGAVWKGLTEKILVGGEITGVVNELERNVGAGSHQDRFYTVRALVAGWRPWGRDRHVVLRAGVGRGQAKIQDTVIQNFMEESRDDSRIEMRTGLVFGASFGIPMGDRVSVGVDLNSSNILSGRLTESVRAAFSSWTFGFKWHP